jgi:predicted metal-dependent hydrolase
MHTITLSGQAHPLVLRRSALARQITLRACATTRTIRLTLPLRARERDALAFAVAKRGWLEAAIARHWRLPVPFADGASIAFRGAPLLLRQGSGRLNRHEGDTLWLGGAPELLAARTTRWLAAQALALLDPESRACAARIEKAVGRVAVGDPARRWASCAANGDLRYSWRLVMAPDFVRTAVVAHEIAHLIHRGHGADFHALAESLAPQRPARRWLAAEGSALHAAGR